MDTANCNNKGIYTWIAIAIIVIAILIGGYLWHTHSAYNSVNNEVDSVSFLDSIRASVVHDGIAECRDMAESNEQKMSEKIIPVPENTNIRSTMPFNPAGCPYLFIMGKDETSMIHGRSKNVQLYDRDYDFTLGYDHPNGTKAMISSNGFGQSLFSDLDFSGNEYEVFFDEFESLRPDCNMQITAMDFDRDGEIEILFSIQSNDYAITKTYVYKLLPIPYRDSIVKYLGVANGQLNMYIEGHNIIAPFGSQGLYEEYTLASNGRLTNIVP